MENGQEGKENGWKRFTKEQKSDLYTEVYDAYLDLWWKTTAEKNEKNGFLELSWEDAIAHAWKETSKPEKQTPEEKNWRLPTVEELSSLINIQVGGPSTEAMKAEYPDWITGDERTGWYWTSSSVANDDTFAWIVFFGNGRVLWLNRDNQYRVRLVRGALRSVFKF